MAVLWEEVEEKVDKDIGQLKAFVEVCVCVWVYGECMCIRACFTLNISPQQKHQGLEHTQSTMHDSLALLETEGKVGRETLSTVLNAEITTR